MYFGVVSAFLLDLTPIYITLKHIFNIFMMCKKKKEYCKYYIYTVSKNHLDTKVALV